MQCPICYHALSPANQTCPNCTQPMQVPPTEGEQKEVTALCADLKGSTALASQLEGETYRDILNAVLEKMSEAVHRVEGTVNQFTGDGVMALFGAPIAHEDHVERALRAALYMQRALLSYLDTLNREKSLSLSFRIGLNTGKIFVGRIGDDLRTDYTAQGLTTNLAQRMESLAAPGQILVTQSVWKRAHGAFQFQEIGEFSLQNREKPIRYFSLKTTLSEETVPHTKNSALAKHEEEFSSPRSYTPKYLAEQILRSRSALEGEQKELTVLFADLTGAAHLETTFSPEVCHDILTAVLEKMFEAVHRVEGTVNQFTSDGIMALFGAPIAHEDHVERALRAALYMQRTLLPYLDTLNREKSLSLSFRIGLNTGKVFVGRIGDDLRMDYTAQGLTTNLAQRMESLAAPGQILVTQSVWQRTHGAFQFQELGEFSVKGLLKPLPVFALQGQADTSISRLEAIATRGLSPFIGRRSEVEHIDRLWDRVQKGNGQLCYLAGSAGVGKSRLAYEFTQKLKTTVITVQTLSYGNTLLYHPFSLLCQEILKYPNDLSPNELLRTIETSLEQRYLPKTYAYFLASLSGIDIKDSRFSHLEAKERQEQTHQAVKELLFYEAKQYAFVVLFEDLHWFDSASQTLLDNLAKEIKTVPVFLLGTARPNFSPTWEPADHITKLPIKELSQNATISLIDHMLSPSRGTRELQDIIFSHTQGNALFIEEILRTLQSNDSLEETSYGVNLVKDNIELSPTLQSLFAARLDRLSENTKQVALTASAIGLASPFPLLSQSVEIPDKLRENILELIQHAVFLTTENEKKESVLRFLNALLQDAAYSSLLRNQRQAIHTRIAKAITSLYREDLSEQSESLAYHYQRSTTPQKAIPYLIKAAERARTIFFYKESLSHLDDALSILEDVNKSQETQTQQRTILLQKERIYETLGQRTRQQKTIHALQKLSLIADNPLFQAETLVRQGDLDTQVGRFEAAETCLKQALALQHQSSNKQGESQVLISLGFLRWNQDRYEEAISYNEAALVLDRELGDQEKIANNMSNLGTLFRSLGDQPKALSYLREAFSIYQTLENTKKQAFTLYNIAHVLRDLQELESAKDHYQRAKDIFETNNDLIMASRALSGLANLYLDQKQTEKGLELYQEVLKITQEIQYGHGLSHALRSIGEILLVLENPKEAVPYLLKSTTVFSELQDKDSERQVLLTLATLFQTSLPEREKAINALEKVLSLSEKEPEIALETLQNLAKLSQKAPTEKRLSYYQKALALSRTLGQTTQEGPLLNNIALLYWSIGSYEEALATYQEALKIHQKNQDLHKEGFTRNSIGATLRKIGREKEALKMFEKAIEINQQVGQKLFVGHAMAAIGDIYCAQEEYLRAIFQYHASLTIRKELQDKKGIAWMCYSLAKANQLQGDLSQAKKFVTQAKEYALHSQEKELENNCVKLEQKIEKTR